MRQVNLNSRAGSKVVNLLEEYPQATTAWIARKLGLSVQYVRRVRQLLAALAGNAKDAADLDENEEDEQFRPLGPASVPTSAAPGSEEKVRVLVARYEAKEELWHPLDGGECYSGETRRVRPVSQKPACLKCRKWRAKSRGLCQRCRTALGKLVSRGEETWESLMEKGLVYRPKVRPVADRDYKGKCSRCGEERRIHHREMCRRCYDRRDKEPTT